MSYIKFVSNIILIVIFSLNTIDVFAVDLFKYESRHGRHPEGSGQIMPMPEKRSLQTYNLKCPKQEYIHPCDCLGLSQILIQNIVNNRYNLLKNWTRGWTLN